MFSTLKTRLLLGVYIFIILSIPVGAYLASETQTVKSSASEGKVVTRVPVPKSSSSPAQDLLKSSEVTVGSTTTDSSTDDSSSPTIATSFGPTLSLKITLEGRPAQNQTTKLFVGILEGTLGANPKFLLSFTVDIPADGTYTNLSLAGLTPGSTYTALVKGAAQLAGSSVFVMSPTVTNLNDGQAINLLSGDLNDDNAVTAADLAIAQKVLGTTSTSSNWNSNVDLNMDGIINLFDLAIISQNMDKTGASGAWTSPIPMVSTASASLNIHSSQGGYWMWLPK